MQLHARPSPWNSSPSLEVLNSKVGWHSDWSQITSHVIWPIQNSITKVTALPFRSGGPPAYALHVGTSHSFVAQSQQNARWVFSTRTFVKSQVAPPIVKEKLTEWIKEFINDMFNQLQPETRNEELRCLTLFWHFAAVHCFCSANIQPDPAQTNCSAIYPSNNSRCCSAKAFSSCAIDICLNTSGLGKPKKKTCVNPSVPLIHLTTVKHPSFQAYEESIVSRCWACSCWGYRTASATAFCGPCQPKICLKLSVKLPPIPFLWNFTGSLLLAKSGDFLSTFSHKIERVLFISKYFMDFSLATFHHPCLHLLFIGVSASTFTCVNASWFGRAQLP